MPHYTILIQAQEMAGITDIVLCTLTRLYILHFKPSSESFRLTPLRADHHIKTRLVPKVIAHRSRVPRLPAAFDIKRLTIQYNETS